MRSSSLSPSRVSFDESKIKLASKTKEQEKNKSRLSSPTRLGRSTYNQEKKKEKSTNRNLRLKDLESRVEAAEKELVWTRSALQSTVQLLQV